MGSLFLLNDSEKKIYWKKNIFKMEEIIKYDSFVLMVLSFIAYITFPFDSLKYLNKQNNSININLIVILIFSLSVISFLLSLLIKNAHLNNVFFKKRLKPNYRLCIMNSYGYVGFISTFICFILSIILSFIIMDLEAITGIIKHRSLSSEQTSKKIFISIGRAIYIIILNNFMLIASIFAFIDYYVEITIISRAAKYLSIGNNINNQNLLYELFKIPITQRTDNNKNTLNNFDNLNSIDKRENFTKLRLIMSDKNNEDEGNYFENENNKFREVEIIQKIEYKSIGVQTGEDEIQNKNYKNNYINNNIDKTIDADLSNNFILIKNKSLMDSKTSLNEVLTQSIK